MQGAFSHIRNINLLKCPVGYTMFVIRMPISSYTVINIYIKELNVFS